VIAQYKLVKNQFIIIGPGVAPRPEMEPHRSAHALHEPDVSGNKVKPAGGTAGAR
jgi:hypothetical protein